jgi:hypothetical protein
MAGAELVVVEMDAARAEATDGLGIVLASASSKTGPEGRGRVTGGWPIADMMSVHRSKSISEENRMLRTFHGSTNRAAA